MGVNLLDFLRKARFIKSSLALQIAIFCLCEKGFSYGWLAASSNSYMPFIISITDCCHIHIPFTGAELEQRFFILLF